MVKINEVTNRDELAYALGIPKKKLTYILYVKKTENLYYSFEIPKKNGGFRRINAPDKDLRDIQKSLANILVKYQKAIWDRKNIKPYISHGYEKNKGIMTNAEVHKNKRFVFNVDLKDFFDCFHFGRVRGFFEKNKHFCLPIEVATIIAQLTCYNGVLPQGAPTSPVITNLICNIFDMRVMKVAKKYKLNYTRYVDDLTFSTNDKNFFFNKELFFENLIIEVENAGFKINDKKTRLQFKDSRQTVTGLVVNKKINVDRRFYKDTRAMLDSLFRNGSFEIDGYLGDIKQLEGRLSFINQIEWHNNLKDNSTHNVYNLSSKEKQYQAFLFYKYFFSNKKPILVTEGKTDIKYIKAALKKYYLDYPDLIIKNEKQEFEFKITFLKRTKRLQYFFNLYKDGADTMIHIYNYFYDVNNDRFTNYVNFFTARCKRKPANPTIFIFDNEINVKGKPLKKFVDNISLNDLKVSKLLVDNYVDIAGSAYILVNPIIDRTKNESEIEDLFTPELLSHKINGKTFCRDKSFNSSKHYSKEIFANHVVKNYRSIDFINFKPMLDNLDKIIKNYNR
ncbi:hypothetical protein IGK15_001588 [Enterococcus sp. AZ045]|uniref:retron Ec67 family RNA-directed DNA polymerase/endonuclease n=1 Tax=Enterococcus sp. AZ045 TaxID=2774807 RepID=UPI003F1ED567